MCWPVHKYWYSKTQRTCGNGAQYIFEVIGVTIATDVLVTVIPAWILHDLQMPPKHKLGVFAFHPCPFPSP